MRCNYWSHTLCEWCFYGDFDSQADLDKFLDEKGYNKRNFYLEPVSVQRQDLKPNDNE